MGRYCEQCYHSRSAAMSEAIFRQESPEAVMEMKFGCPAGPADMDFGVVVSKLALAHTRNARICYREFLVRRFRILNL